MQKTRKRVTGALRWSACALGSLWALLCSHTSPEPKYHREWSGKDRPPLRLTFWCLAGIGSCTRLWGCRGWGAPNKPRGLPGVPKPCPRTLRRTCTPAGPYQARQAAATLAHPCLQVHAWPTSAHRGAPSPIPAPPPPLLWAPGAYAPTPAPPPRSHDEQGFGGVGVAEESRKPGPPGQAIIHPASLG